MVNADLTLIIFLVIGAVAGLFRGWWRCFVGILILGIVSFGLYFGAFDYAWQWVQYDSLEFLSKTFNFSLTFDIQEVGITLRLTNIRDTFLLLQNVGLDPVLLNATSDGVSKSLVAFIGFIAVLPISFILSTLLYWILLKWIMPRRLRKGILARLFGAILGTIEMGAIGVLFLQFAGNLAAPIESVLLPQLQNSSSELSTLLQNLNVGADQISGIANIVQNACTIMNPISENSVLVRNIFEALNNMGFSPFNFISVQVIDETGAKVNIAFKDAFTDMLDNFVDVGVGKLNTLLGA